MFCLAGVLVTGLASIGMSFITDYTQGMICRVITGLGAGVGDGVLQ